MKAVNPFEILRGCTQSYIEVFGDKCEYTIETEFNNVTYKIFDRYCMNPRCKCKQVFLNFIEDTEDQWHKGADFTISLSFKNKRYNIMDSFQISKDEVGKVVKHSLKDSEEAIKLFQLRYKEMKEAGRKVLYR